MKGLAGVKAVSAGGLFSLALLSNGTVKAWGLNTSGQLGNATFASSDLPVTVKGLAGVRAILSAGGQDSLALLSNGTVRAWGSNTVGELGNGSTVADSDVPVAVRGLASITAVRRQLRLTMLCAAPSSMRGYNHDGELGNGTSTDSSLPVAVKGLSGVRAISAGGGQGLALLSGGTVRAWGYNGEGELGNGTNTSSDVPVAVRGLAGVKAVSAGGDNSLALLPTPRSWPGGTTSKASSATAPTPTR